MEEGVEVIMMVPVVVDEAVEDMAVDRVTEEIMQVVLAGMVVRGLVTWSTEEIESDVSMITLAMMVEEVVVVVMVRLEDHIEEATITNSMLWSMIESAEMLVEAITKTLPKLPVIMDNCQHSAALQDSLIELPSKKGLLQEL